MGGNDNNGSDNEEVSASASEAGTEYEDAISYSEGSTVLESTFNDLPEIDTLLAKV